MLDTVRESKIDQVYDDLGYIREAHADILREVRSVVKRATLDIRKDEADEAIICIDQTLQDMFHRSFKELRERALELGIDIEMPQSPEQSGWVQAVKNLW